MLKLDHLVCVNSDNLSTTVDGETVILDIATGVYLNLNVMGSEIFRRLEQEMTLRDLCAELSCEFSASSEQIEREVISFASRLHDAGLIRLVK
jgi:hypothetical protein